ncbi:MAG: hypothetical protein KDD32_12935, partial [Bacteroidetes bacterium]|nr:hypothetical protein [Bacteroidota bacterium]
MKKGSILLLLQLFVLTVFAQTYLMNGGGSYGNQTTAQSNPVNTCTGNFYDAGGSGGNYNNNMNRWLTFCPDDAGLILNFSFSSFNTETIGSTVYDYLEVYEGATLMATWAGNLGAISYVASSPGTCVTFHFVSDISDTRSGWAAAISCEAPCVSPTAALSAPDVNVCAQEALNPGNLNVAFDASASFSNDAYPIISYEWDWGDGTTTTTATATTTHSYPS